MAKQFHKIYLSPEQHIRLLKERGLIIEDAEKAESYVSTIGYFRLTAYLYPLLEKPKTAHCFKKSASFAKAMDMYRFDRKLRVLLFNEIEKIEIAVRSRIANIVSEATGDIFWMTDPKYFANSTRFAASLSAIDTELAKSKEDFIIHYKQTYSNQYPPAWMIAEILPLGTLTHIYSNIKDNSLRKRISKEFGLSYNVFESWLFVLYGLRNMCCHHSRTWNRELAIITMEPRKTRYKWIDASSTDKRRMYYRICMIRYLLFSVAPNNGLKQKLISLLNQYPTVDEEAMGFPDEWQDDGFWR